jgi:hypothetical protein
MQFGLNLRLGQMVAFFDDGDESLSAMTARYFSVRKIIAHYQERSCVMHSI